MAKLIDSLLSKRLTAKIGDRYKIFNQIEDEIDDLQYQLDSLQNGSDGTIDMVERKNHILKMLDQKCEELKKTKAYYNFDRLTIYRAVKDLFEEDDKFYNEYKLNSIADPSLKKPVMFEDTIKFPQLLEQRYGNLRTFITTKYNELYAKISSKDGKFNPDFVDQFNLNEQELHEMVASAESIYKIWEKDNNADTKTKRKELRHVLPEILHDEVENIEPGDDGDER